MKLSVLASVLLLTCAALLTLSACGPGEIFEDPEARGTREALSTQYVGTIAVVQTNAPTITALAATAQSASIPLTQVANLAQQNGTLQAQIVALGSGQSAAPVVQAQQPPFNQAGAQPPAQPGSGASVAGGGTLVPTFTPDPSVAAAPVANATATPPAGGSTTGGGLTFAQTATATGVGDADGCATSLSQTFDAASTTEIYLTTVAYNVQPGTTFGSRWYFNNQLIFETPPEFNWTPDETFDEVCIWFYAEAVDLDLVPGSWVAELTANGQTATRATFQVTGSAPVQTAPTEDMAEGQ